MTKTAKTKKTPTPKKPVKPTAKKAKALTKADQWVRLMSRPNGVSIDEALKALPMQVHSLRGLISTVKKVRGLKVEYTKDARRYRIID